MRCGRHDDIWVRQGDDVGFEVAITDDAGDPFDLSGILNAWFSMRREQDPVNVQVPVSCSVSGGGIVVSVPASLGVLTVALTREQTSAMYCGVWDTEVRLKQGDGSIETALEGYARVIPQVQSE